MSNQLESNEPSTLSLSVIVPVHKDGEHFRRCLSCLAQATPPPNEVIIVEDCAGKSRAGKSRAGKSRAGENNTGGGIRQLAEVHGFRYFRNLTSKGPSGTRNLGALHARSDLLLFVDSDVTIPEDTVACVQTAFNDNPQLAAIIGSYDDEPAADNFLSQYKNLFHHYVHQNSKETASTFWGACGAIRCGVFRELGGFDKRYNRPAIEDIELGTRIIRAGHQIQLYKKLQCKHLKKWGIASLLKSDFFDRALPWTELILNRQTLIDDLNLRLSSRFSTAFLFISIALFMAGFWKPESALIALIFLTAVLALNLPLYRFFAEKRGIWFMIRVVPWHCIYFMCCGMAFGFGLIRALFKRTVAFLGKAITGKHIDLSGKMH